VKEQLLQIAKEERDKYN
jgi:hypothetical protein